MSNGNFNINNITPTAAFLGATPTSSFSSKIRFPSIVSVGYGIQISDSFRLESDVEWIQFSRFKSLNINAGNNTFLFGTVAMLPKTGRTPSQPESAATGNLPIIGCCAAVTVLPEPRAGFHVFADDSRLRSECHHRWHRLERQTQFTRSCLRSGFLQRSQHYDRPKPEFQRQIHF